MKAIELRGLVKEFRIRQRRRKGAKGGEKPKPKIIRPLDGLSLDVDPGTAVGLVGPNGTGKTTTLKICATVIAPDAGEGTIYGSPLHKTAEVRKKIGLITPNDRSFYWRLSGRHNLQFFGALQNLSTKEINYRADKYAEMFSVDYLDRRYDQYSTGMRQSLAMLRCLLHEPDILLLDEPTRSLDIEHTLRFRKNLDAMLSDGHHSVLMVTHNHSLAHAICQKVLTMEGGKIVRSESAKKREEEAGQAYEITISLLAETERAGLEQATGVDKVDQDVNLMQSKVTTVADPDALGNVLKRIQGMGFLIIDVRPTGLSGLSGKNLAPTDEEIVRNKTS